MPPSGLLELFSQGLWSLRKGILPPAKEREPFPKTRLGRAIVCESPHTYTIRQKTPEKNTHQVLVAIETPRHAVVAKCFVAQPVWYGSAIPQVTGSIPVGKGYNRES